MSAETRSVDRPAVLAGTRAGLAVLVPLFVLQVVLVVAADDPGGVWVAVLLVGFAAAFARGGYRSAVTAPGRRLLHGALGALAVLAVWIPLRLVIAALSDGDNPLAGVVSAAALAALVGAAAGLFVLKREAADS